MGAAECRPQSPTLQSRSMPATLFPIILVAHIGLAISLFLPSILFSVGRLVSGAAFGLEQRML